MKAAPVIRLECPSLVFSTAFHPSQELIACSTVLGQISLHNLSSKTASLFSHHQDSCRTLAFSPGGSAIFSGSSDGSLHMTDINGKLILRRKLAHDDSINIVKCLDENLVATGCDGGTVRVWDIRTRKRICEYSATDYISDLHFVPDSKILLSTSGDGSLCAFELRKKIPVFSAHQDGTPLIIQMNLHALPQSATTRKFASVHLQAHFFCSHTANGATARIDSRVIPRTSHASSTEMMIPFTLHRKES